MPGAYNVIPVKWYGLEIRIYPKNRNAFCNNGIAIETKTKKSLKGKPMNQNQHWLIKLCSKPLKDQPKQWIKYKIHAAVQTRLARNSIDCSNSHDFLKGVWYYHSPKEFTKSIDMANGANVLFQTILALDKT
jgi:hypothetical protein